MKFKSVKEMKSKAFREKYKMTEEQKKWIDEFRKLIKDKLDEVYDIDPSLGQIVVGKYIDRTLVHGVEVEEFFIQIEYIKDYLKELGYSLREDHSHNVRGLIDGYTLYIEWELPL